MTPPISNDYGRCCWKTLRTRRPRRAVVGLALVWLLSASMLVLTRDASAMTPCDGCELLLGLGDTYHFWADTGALVVPATLTLDHDRYELGVFRVTSQQTLFEHLWGRPHVMADPYWGFSASRRWQLTARPTWRLLFGFGVSYKTEEDLLNATHWNFAEQLVLRLNRPFGGRHDMEFAIRHWSNAGMRCPNRGQDFFTVSVTL